MYHETSSNPPRPDTAGPLTAGDPRIGAPPKATPAAPFNGTVSPALEKQIVAIEQQLDSLKNQPIDELAEDLESYAKGAVESANATLSAAQYAIVYAWATGCVLNLAKEILGRGQFGKWRDARAEELGMSKRTAQNWMKLARDCWDVRALLVPGASLTSAYRAAGVLPEADPADPASQDQDDICGEEGDPSPLPAPPSPTEQAFTALAEGRKRLRHLVESAGILEEGDRDRLEQEKSDFITLIDKLIYPVVP